MDAININDKFSKIKNFWSPGIIGELNGQYVKLAKLKDDFVWHSHKGEDELFMVIKGVLYMHFKEKITVVKEGEILIVPKGVEHKPETKGEEVQVLLFEPKDTLHTGEVIVDKTNNSQEWI
ncbi:cupin domain-containing protein [Chondrinema litorale]|uniref:cupin domain-containing protein n=1 Tax=Chondrinema litorale TaxID=2994555 RepID=UPI002543E761|nr:cupin domain-containing protein [Chondrinema litorale]UZR99331.1 cupin domain-containing protein [Chondrinema litorale]